MVLYYLQSNLDYLCYDAVKMEAVNTSFDVIGALLSSRPLQCLHLHFWIPHT